MGRARKASILELTKRKGKVIIIGSYLRVLGVAVIVAVTPLITKGQHPDSVKVYVTKDQVFDYAKQIGIQHPDIVSLQFIIETGNCSSNLCRNYNNLFGFKKHRRLASFSTGTTKSGYAIYPNWKSSVADYLIWQILYARDLSREQYLIYLNRVYAPNQNYFEKFVGK